MFEFKDLENLPLEELFKILGMLDFTYQETNAFIQELESYRIELINKIKNQNGNDRQGLDTVQPTQ